LIRMYYGRRMSLSEMADDAGVAVNTIVHWMDKYGLERSHQSVRPKGPNGSVEWDSEDKLRELHHFRGLTIEQIANKYGREYSNIRSRMRYHGVERVSPQERASERASKRPANYRVSKRGYCMWRSPGGSRGKIDTVRVHQLLAIANGESPKDVFSDRYHVHHENGVKWDNRPSNVSLKSAEAHLRDHIYENESMKSQW